MNVWDDPTHVRPWCQNGFDSLLREYAGVRVEAVGIRRSWPHVPRDLAKIVVGAITGNLSKTVSEAWNVLGWCVFAIGQKPIENESNAYVPSWTSSIRDGGESGSNGTMGRLPSIAIRGIRD